MRVAWSGWYVLSSLLCVLAYPAREPTSNFAYPKEFDLESLASSFSLAGTRSAKLAKVIESDLNDAFEVDPIPLKDGGIPSNNGLKRPAMLTLEPDAEMLPAHYTGVKPPGVDHMEVLTSADSASMASERKNAMVDGSANNVAKMPASVNQVGGARAALLKKSERTAKGEQGGKKVIDFEKSLIADVLKESKKADYEEAAGKKKSLSEDENHANGWKDVVLSEKGAAFEVDGSRSKGHNVAGHRNVYHKDEYKKDADFYDNDHQGGRFVKHGRYNEKHASIEGTFKKGGSHNSGFDEARASASGKLEKDHNSEGAQGHAAQEGYKGFFENLDNFARKEGLVQFDNFAFDNGDAGKSR